MTIAAPLKEQAIGHIREKRAGLVSERERVSVEVSEASRRLRQIDEEIADCDAAARVFGITLSEAEPAKVEASPSEAPQRAEAANGLGSGLSHAQTLSAGMSERAIIGRILQNAYPRPLTKLEVHRILTEELHIKTTVGSVGSQLYRCAVEDRAARRIKNLWYFVPENERGSSPGAKASASSQGTLIQ